VDIPRIRPPRRRAPWIAAAVAFVVLGSLGLSQLRPAGPEVEASTLWIGEVVSGPMLREVRGPGTLVPEEQRFVPALTAGRVERVHVRAGTAVEPGTVLLELSNPDVQLEALEAERQLKLAEADLAGVRATLEGGRLAQEQALAASRTEMREAARGVAVAERLERDGLISGMEVERARDRATEAHARLAADSARLVVAVDALRAQLALRASDLERIAAIARFHRERLASMTVRAGVAGVVQELDLQPGQWVMPGQQLARVARPERLKAVIRVPDTQARDLTHGLAARVDTRNGVVAGRVTRIDPAVQNGSVAVDITLEGALPLGARPDLSVDATIEFERLAETLSVERPANVSTGSQVHLFRLDRGGRAATRVAVRLGRASATRIEVLDGLAAGDRVIVSDMSRWDAQARVRLH
jgi:RND family efflux transporter MFP subunit